MRKGLSREREGGDGKRERETQTVVVEKLLDQVHMAEQHPTTAVTFQPQSIQGLGFVIIVLKNLQILLPLVPDDLTAGEAPHLREG